MNTVALVVLSYNKPNLTATCIRSLLNLLASNALSAPLILVHNGSLAENRRRLQSEFPSVRHVILESNAGFTGGANAGLRAAFESAPWAIFVSNDVTLMNVPNVASPPADFFGPLIYRRQSQRVDSAGARCVPATGSLSHFESPSEFETPGFQKWHQRPYIPGSTFAISKLCFEQTGGFDETLGTYWEDVDVSIRAVQNGFTLGVDPAWRARHGIGKTCHGDSLYTIYYFQRNRLRVSLRLTPPALRFLVGIFLLLRPLKLYTRLLRGGRRDDARLLIRALREGWRASF